MIRKIKSKRGVSVVLGYVLLIVISISLAFGIYAWMKGLVPRGEKKCPDISLIISDCKIENSVLTLCIQNKGLFDISGFYIKVSNKTGRSPIIQLQGLPLSRYYEKGIIDFAPELRAGDKIENEFDLSGIGEIQKIEIEPYKTDKEKVLCYEAVIRQELSCSLPDRYSC